MLFRSGFSALIPCISSFFFFNDTATTEIYTLSLHDALPISLGICRPAGGSAVRRPDAAGCAGAQHRLSASTDRKSTRLNSSHLVISYAVFCLKKKNHSARPTLLRLSDSPPVETPSPYTLVRR